MTLSDDIARIAGYAAEYARAGEELSGIVVSEPRAGARVYLCAYGVDDDRSWLALDERGIPIEERAVVRDAVSIAAMCELAVEVAGGGDLEQLRAELVALRLRENPPGIDEAEDAALALERTLGAPPRLATPAYLDQVGGATRRLERALGDETGSPFAEAMKQAIGAVDSLTGEVEGRYKGTLR